MGQVTPLQVEQPHGTQPDQQYDQTTTDTYNDDNSPTSSLSGFGEPNEDLYDEVTEFGFRLSLESEGKTLTAY
jgi:hypothetical protein